MKPAFQGGFLRFWVSFSQKVAGLRGANLSAHPASLPIFLIPVESLVLRQRRNFQKS
jgi:hypothetical protein